MTGGGNQDDRSGGAVEVVVRTQLKTHKPSMYKVILLNDDYTPMEFVVQVLESVFSKPTEEAMRIMLQVHQKGSGVCGVYTYEVAETKVSIVVALAKEAEQPLQCVMEKA
ncbi:MAG: ATP-dependent Clp protease adapter ClpS [Bdellovibrionales bacterium]